MNWVLSFLAFVSVSTISGIVTAFLFQGLNKLEAIISLLIGLMVAFFVLLSTREFSQVKKEKINFWTYFILFAFGLFALRSFLWLIYKKGEDLFVLSPYNLGDISLHVNHIQYFTNGCKFWPESTILTGNKLHYPIGIDLFNSLLTLVGIDLIKGLISVGILFSIVTAFVLFIWGREFALAGFLFNGGIAGFVFFQNFKIPDLQAQLAWKSIPLTLFVTQRGFLYAFPVGLLLLYSWRNRFFLNDEKESLKNSLPLWLEVLFYSTMPVFHVHTFVFLSLMLTIWLLISPGNIRIKILKLILFSIIQASILFFTVAGFQHASSFYLKAGWMQNNENFFTFWFYNFGLLFPLVIWLCIRIISGGKDFLSKASFQFVFPAIFLFIVFCMVMTSRWEWDNIKFLVWSYLIILPFLWEELISKWDFVSKTIVCFLLFFSGFICLINGLDKRHGYKNYSLDEIKSVCSLTKNLPIENPFASYPAYNHPLIFCGKKLVLAYPGWVWSHGYNIGDTEEKLKKLMLGDKEWKKLAKELQVKYIFWGERETQEYLASAKLWEKETKKITSSQWGEIYDLGDL